MSTTYAFDPVTGRLIAELLASPGNTPAERADLTDVAPPTCAAGQVPFWDGTAWACQTWPPAPGLAELRAAAWERIKARRNVAFAATATSSAGIPYSIAFDKANLADRLVSLSGAIAAGLATSATTISWRDRNNAAHSLTLADLNLLAAEMGARGQAIYEKSWALDALVTAAVDQAELDAIDYETGWP